MRKLATLLGCLLFAVSLFAASGPNVVSTSVNSAVTQLTISGSGFSPAIVFQYTSGDPSAFGGSSPTIESTATWTLNP